MKARQVIHESTAEAQWQGVVLDWARFHGWRRMAYHDSRTQWWGTDAGWPDLFLVRGTRAIAAELKTQRGGYRDGQEDWLAALAGVPGIETYTWRPSDEDEMRRVLA